MYTRPDLRSLFSSNVRGRGSWAYSINTVEATAAALGEAVEEYPETAEAVVGTLVNSFEGLGTQGRVGIGLALKECATVVDYSIMRGILDFLLLRGLTDLEERVREARDAVAELLSACRNATITAVHPPKLPKGVEEVNNANLPEAYAAAAVARNANRPLP